MSIKLCPHCYAWRCHPDDRFCGHCSENLLEAEVIIEPVSTIYQGGEVPSEIRVTIRNVRGGLGGTKFFWRDKAGREIAIVDLDQNALNQLDEQEFYQTKSADLGLDPAVPVEWSLIHWVASNKEYTRAILSCGLEVPVLVLEKSEFTIQDSAPLSLMLQHKSGGPALVKGIEVSAYEGAALNLPDFDQAVFPFTLSQDEQQALTLPITEKLWNVLQARPQGLELTLAVQFNFISYSLDLPLKLRVPMPARLQLKLLDEVRALEGRFLRLPIVVENQGGENCQLSSVQVDIRRGPEVIHSFGSKPAHPYTLEAGKSYRDILKISLFNEQGQALIPGPYQCDVEQVVVEESVDNPKSQTELRIRAAKKYTGIVTIDFGTTATAVSVYPQGNSKPSSIPLSDKDKFIPTAIAYFLDDEDQLQYCIGYDAIALLDNQAISDIVYLDNLKWRLDNKEPVLLPDGSVRTWEEIAVDYLKKIKNIVEEYTDVVAVVERVVITQPSRFHPLLMRALNSTYRKAGFMPLPVQLGDNAPHNSLAESWPSLTTSLPLGHLKSFQDDTVGYKVFGEELVGKHVVLTYDVGGGSTDMSLFLVEIENYAKMRMTELGTDGTGLDDRFFGNGFSDLLFKHLKASCENWLERQGYDLKQFPITLPWQRLRLGDKIARKNGRRCAAFVLEHLQGDGGPFNNIHLRLQNIGVWDEKDNKELVNLMNEFQEAFDLSLAESRLCLQSLHGTEVEIPGGSHNQGNGVFLDFENFINDFIDICSGPMFERLERLLNHSKVYELKVYLITTGRGAFFPLVRSMLWAHQERLRGKNDLQKLEPVRVEQNFAKTIVSIGACHLARLSKGAGELVFVPRNLPSLGMEGGPDPETGKTLFIPLCAGLPTPADGWQVAAYPMRSGGCQEVSVTLYLSADNKRVLTDNDKLLGEVSDFVDLKPENEVKDAHIMVKAEVEDCLDIYLGFPHENQRDEYDSWDKYLLGQYEIVEGACAKARENQKRLTLDSPTPDGVPIK